MKRIHHTTLSVLGINKQSLQKLPITCSGAQDRLCDDDSLLDYRQPDLLDSISESPIDLVKLIKGFELYIGGLDGGKKLCPEKYGKNISQILNSLDITTIEGLHELTKENI